MARVIDVPGMGPTLFSPVFAHSLVPGDLIIGGGDYGLAFYVMAVLHERLADGSTRIRVTYDVPWFGDSDGLLGMNEPVLRAVGARAGGVR